MTNLPSVSVIIPVFNPTEPIEVCLTALESQSYPRNIYEIIVVNNSPDIRKFESLKNFPDIIFLHEPNPSSYSARNLGIKRAKGKVIAFTDADCIPDENWLQKGVSDLLEIQNCGLLAGKLIVFCKNNTSPTSTEMYEVLSAFPQKIYVEKGKFGVTANLFTFREVFEDVGLFNEKLISSGDKEWGKRVYRTGYQLSYSEDAYVQHPARSSVSSLRKKMLRVACGLYQLSKIEECKEKNKIKYKIKQFMQVLIDISRTVCFISKVFNNSEIKGFQKRLIISLLACYVRYLRIAEALRLELGLSPRVTR